MPRRLDLARQWIDGSRSDLAERELRRYLADQPDDGAAHALLAMALISLRRGDEALDAMREAARLAPHDPTTVQAVAEVHVRMARPEAELAVRRALALYPDEPVYHALLAAALMQRPAHAYAAARLSRKALAAADAGLALDPGHTECLIQRAQALLRLGRIAEARTASEAALRIAPESAANHVVHAAVEQAAGNRRLAVRAIREALRADPNDEQAQQELRKVYESVRLGAAILLEAERSPAWLRAAAVLLTLCVASALVWGHEADVLGSLGICLFGLLGLDVWTLPWRLTLWGRARMDELRVPGALTEAEMILTRAFMIIMLATGIGIVLLASIHEPASRTGAPNVWHLPWNHQAARGTPP